VSSYFGDVHEMAIDVPPYYNEVDERKQVNKTVGEPSPQTHVSGMLKYSRTQPKAESFGRDSNVPAKYYNEAFDNDEKFRESNIPSKFVNEAFDQENGDEFVTVTPSRRVELDSDEAKSLGFAQFITLLDEVGKKLKGDNYQNDVSQLRHLFSSKNFQSAVKTHNHMTKIALMRKNMKISNLWVPTLSYYSLRFVTLSCK